MSEIYYTHEYSNEHFYTYEDCYDDLESVIGIDDYLEYLDCYEILRQFFRRKTNDEFCNWFEGKLYEEILPQIANELISEHEYEED